MPHPFRAPRSYQPTAMEAYEKRADDAGSFVTVSHPSKIGYGASFCGAFFGSFIFIALLNIGTGFLVDHCTIAADGTATGACAYTPAAPVSAAQVGTHPDFLGNLVLLAMVAFGARYVAQHVAGLWSQGDIDLHFTFLRAVKAMAVKDEPLLLGHRLLALLGQALGALGAIFFTWGMLQGRGSYSDGAEGLGGPGITTRGLQSVGRTIFLVIFIAFIRSLVFLWANVKRGWTTQTGSVKRGGEVIAYNKYDTDHIATGLTHHAQAGMLATVDGVLAVVTGAIFGPSIGFFWRDMASLALTEHTAVVNEATEGFSLWLLSGVFVPIGNIIAIAVCFFMLVLIRERGYFDSRAEKKKTED